MEPAMAASPFPTVRGRLGEVAWVFLKLGTIAFGGPAAHIAMMEEEVVRRRRWLEREAFLDLVGATNLIPGPNSTELALHLGYVRAGWRGLVAAGVCFIVPAMAVVGVIAWAYVRYGALPELAGVLRGVKPVILAVVAQATWSLTRTAVKTRFLGVAGGAALLAVVLGAHELAVLAATAVASALWSRGRRAGGRTGAWFALPMLGSTGAATVATVPASFGLGSMFLFFLKVGSVLFGSGYVLLAFLRADLVERLGWLTEGQLLDAVAVGQVTPGPVFTTATFIGYLLAGSVGALVATVGIFLPAFVFVALSGPLVRRLRASPTAGAVLDGVNVASLALMGAVGLVLARAAVVDPTTGALAVLATVLLVRYRVNSAYLVLGGAALGALALLI
jgi:chromate transporter